MNQMRNTRRLNQKFQSGFSLVYDREVVFFLLVGSRCDHATMVIKNDNDLCGIRFNVLRWYKNVIPRGEDCFQLYQST